MGWKRRGVLAAVGGAVVGAGCFGSGTDTDETEETPSGPLPETPVLDRQERPNTTGTEEPPTEPAGDGDDNTPTDTDTPEPAEPDTPEPPEHYSADDLDDSIWWAQNSLNRSMPVYNNEYSIPEPLLRTHSGSVTASEQSGGAYQITATAATYSGGRYGNIGAYLASSSGRRDQLTDELGHGLAYMITSTMKLSRAQDLDDYLPAEQPAGSPNITEASYRIDDHSDGEVGVELDADALTTAASIIETTDRTTETWDRIYEDVVQDDMYVEP
jgi:hypothetical protein